MVFDSVLINIIGFTLILLLNLAVKLDKISKFMLYSFQGLWAVILFTTCFKPYGLYLPSEYCYILLLLNVFCFSLGFSIVKPKSYEFNISNDNVAFISAKKLVSNKFFLIYLIIITCYIMSLLSVYFAKIAVSNSLGEVRQDFFYENFYGPLFTYLDLLFLSPTQIIFLGLGMYCLFRYRTFPVYLMLIYMIIYSTLGAGRLDYATILMSFIFFAACLTKLNIKRFILISSLSIVVFAVICYVTNMRGIGEDNYSEAIVQGVDATIENAVTYSCGAIVAFDHALEDDYVQQMGGHQYGALTFAGVVSSVNIIAKRFGESFDEPLSKLVALKQDQRINIGATNTHNALYTFVLYPYLDFGILGVIFIPFFFGIIVRNVISKLYKYRSIWLIILANYCFMLMINSVLDFRGMYKPTSLLLFIILFFSDKLFKSRKLV